MRKLLLEKKLQSILKSVGWTENRQFDTTEWITELRSRGLEILHTGVEALNEFGGIHYSNEVSENELLNVDLIFDPRGTSIESLHYWNSRAGLKLFPIGEVDGQAELLVDEFGGWYLAMSGLWKIGDDANQALKFLFFGEGVSLTVSRPK